MRAFIRNNLGPADFLGEVLFGLIMALGFTGAVRLGHEEADSRALFIGILGCNIAWAVVDGVMYSLTELFERGRRSRLARKVLAEADDRAALELISGELGPTLDAMTTPDQRDALYRGILANLRASKAPRARIRREDVLGGIAVGLVILIWTLPIVAPYLLFQDPEKAVRVSNGVALTLLFLLGTWWGRVIESNPLRIGAGLTVIGLILVGVTIALGG
jgi:VIT1/CCC1 family predicted Fe2+/Mn2+ transporter